MQYLSAMLIACAMLALGLGACSTPEAPGLTLLPAESPVAGDTFAPRLSVDADGHLLLSYLSKTDAGHALQFVRHDGSSWTAPRTVAEGDDWFANWADTPGVRPVGEWLFAHWLVRSGPAAYHYSIHAAWSVDGGVTWSDPFILHGEGRPAEHGFLSSVVLGDGALGVTWLDGRYTVDSEASHENAASHDAHAAHQGAMSLRWARFEPGETRPTRDIELDNQVCDCCMTASVQEDSGVRVLYRDRTLAEIRDIASVRVTPAGQQHDGRVAADGWEIPACPVEGPAVARRGATTDAVWFTGSESMPKVFWAASSSDAEGFGAATQIDAGSPAGRVGAVALDDSRTLLTWIEATEAGSTDAHIMARTASDSGISAASTLMPTATRRSSGFPVLARTDSTTWIAWTEPADDARHVRVGTIVPNVE